MSSKTAIHPVSTYGKLCAQRGDPRYMVSVQSCWLAATVEPPNKGHIGTSHFVLYREVVLSLEVKNA